MHWRRQWQPTPAFLPGESQGQGSLVGSVYGVTQSRTRLKQLSSSSSREQEHCPGKQTQHFHSAPGISFLKTCLVTTSHGARVAAWLSSRGGMRVDTAKWGQAVSVIVSFPRHLLLPYLPVAPWGAGAGLSMCPPAPSLTRVVPTRQRWTVRTVPLGSWDRLTSALWFSELLQSCLRAPQS